MSVTQEERIQIEEQTRDQDNSDQWQQEWRKRLTASVVGGIAKMKEKTTKNKKVQAPLHSTFRGNQALAMAGQWKLYLFTNMCHTTRSKIPIFELTSVGCSFLKPITG